MAMVSYPVFKDLGQKLTSEHEGEWVIRTYPYMRGDGLSFDCMTTDLNRTDLAKAWVIRTSEMSVVVVKGTSDLLLPNDGHWLLVSDFQTKVKAATAEIFQFTEANYNTLGI